jgi:hypothetical protein
MGAAPALDTGVERRVGSSPTWGTNTNNISIMGMWVSG